MDLRAGDGCDRPADHGRRFHSAARPGRRDRRDRRLADHVRLRAVRAGRARAENRRRAAVCGAERGRGGAAQHLDRPCSGQQRPRLVVEHGRDSRGRHDSACDTAQDAGRVAGRGVDGSARVVDRAFERRAVSVAGDHARLLHAQFCVRRRRNAAVARPAPDRTPAAPRAGDGQLRARGAARARRHGRSLARAASAARTRRGDQARTPRTARRGHGGRGPKHAPPLRARGADDGVSELAAHDPGIRLRRDDRPDVLLRDGAARRPRPAVAGARVRTGLSGARAVPAAAGVSFARRGACSRARPSRRDAVEHLYLPDGPRLRLRQGPRLRPGDVRRRSVAGAAIDGSGPHDGDAGVHGA